MGACPGLGRIGEADNIVLEKWRRFRSACCTPFVCALVGSGLGRRVLGEIVRGVEEKCEVRGARCRRVPGLKINKEIELELHGWMVKLLGDP